MTEKSQACCFTVHRKIPANKVAGIEKRLDEEIVNLIRQGVCDFYAGGALGFDTMAALAVLKLKSEFPNIKLILVLPCRDQTKGWREESVKVYNQILRQADEVVYTSQRYHQGCMQRRNRYLVEHSGVCLCYLTKMTGGTAYTVRYAQEKGLRILYIETP